MVYKHINGIWVLANLREDFPGTSFPRDLASATFPAGYVWVEPTPAPACGSFEHVRPSSPAQIDGVWQQQWEVVPWSEEDLQEWRSALECGPYQMALALDQLGLLSTVEDMIEQAGGMTEFAWRRATTFKRTDPLIESMRQALGKSQEEVDQLFLSALTF